MCTQLAHNKSNILGRWSPTRKVTCTIDTPLARPHCRTDNRGCQPHSTSWLQSDDHKGGDNVEGLSLVQQEIQLSSSSHLARMARRSDMSEWEAILTHPTNGIRLSWGKDSTTRAPTEMWSCRRSPANPKGQYAKPSLHQWSEAKLKELWASSQSTHNWAP
jgi:hypothetical protein